MAAGALLCFALLPPGSYAQETPSSDQNAAQKSKPETEQKSSAESEKKSDSTRTVTGCLSAAAENEAGESHEKAGKHAEYTLTADDGSTWEVSSRKINLAPHVGHTVTLTGRVWHAGMHGAKEAVKGAVSPNATEHGHMRVTNLKMVSETCKK
jgi:hypothetical protein